MQESASKATVQPKANPSKWGLMLTGNDALAVDIIAAKVMMLNWKETYLGYIADKTGMHEDDISVEGLPIATVKHRFEPPQNRFARESANDDLPA